jgi:hypothetical protein
MLGGIHDICIFGKHAKVSRPKGCVVGTQAEITAATLYFGPGVPRSENSSTFAYPK